MTRHLTRTHVLVLVAAVTLAGLGLGASSCQEDRQPSVEAYCAEMADAQGLDESLASFDVDALDRQVDALRDAAAVAPPEIAAQTQTVLGLTEALQATLTTATGDREQALEDALRARQDQVGTVAAAGEAVQVYVATNCGIGLDGTASP